VKDEKINKLTLQVGFLILVICLLFAYCRYLCSTRLPQQPVPGNGQHFAPLSGSGELHGPRAVRKPPVNAGGLLFL